MKLLTWNVNGIRAIAKKGFSEQVRQLDADILSIQETKCQEGQAPEDTLSPADYTSYWSYAERKGYSGVCTYSSIEPKKVQPGIGIEKYDCEGRFLELDYGDFLLYNVYFPNGQVSKGDKERDDEKAKARVARLAYKLDFFNDFLEYLKKKRKKQPNIIICGDYNIAHNEIDLARPKANEENTGFLPEERALMDLWLGSGLVDTFRHLHPDEVTYTWWSYRSQAREKNIGWRLDYFLISEPLQPKLKDAFILNDVMGSDHCPAGIIIDL